MVFIVKSHCCNSLLIFQLSNQNLEYFKGLYVVLFATFRAVLLSVLNRLLKTGRKTVRNVANKDFEVSWLFFFKIKNK